MCIVCEIKEMVNGNNDVIKRVAFLSLVAGGLLELADKIAAGEGVDRHNLNKLRTMGHACYTDVPHAADLRNALVAEVGDADDMTPDALNAFSAVLALVYDAKVEYLKVTPLPGETDEDAAERAIAEHRNKNVTKH